MLKPTSEADLSETLANQTTPVKITGGGTQGIHLSDTTTPLSTNGLSGIKLYDPGALTIVAKSGTTIADIKSTLAKENQRLAFEPMDYRPLLGSKGEPTIGGVIAANLSGPRRISVGAARDFLLGVRFVDGTGNIVSNGGRVMKNVTGYDLVKLLAGSYGTLGVLSELSLKVLPSAEDEATITIPCDTAKTAVDLMSAALGSPFDVTGVAFDKTTNKVSLRLEGFTASVHYRAEKLADHLGVGPHATTLTATESKKHWKTHRDVSGLSEQAGDIWRISVKPSDAPTLISALEPTHYQLDWGGGLIWALTPSGENIRPKIANFKGHATLIRAAKETFDNLPKFQPQPAPISKISAALRAKFDPKGILNPGLMN